MTEPDDRLAEHFAGLRDESPAAFSGPGPDAVAAAGRRRRRARYGVAAAVAVVIVVAAGVAVNAVERPATLRPVEQPVASPTTSPVPGGSPSPSGRVTSLRATDWRNAILTVPRYGVCTAERLRFRSGAARFGDLKYRMLPSGEPEYGDVTGDGLPDAIVALDCVGVGSRVTEYQPAVVAYTENAEGGPRLLGVVAQINPQTTGPRYWIEDGAVVVDANEVNSSAGVRRYRWTGGAFEES